MSKLNKQVIEDLIRDCKIPKDFCGKNGFVKAVMESALRSELSPDLGYEEHDVLGYNSGNSRHGTS